MPRLANTHGWPRKRNIGGKVYSILEVARTKGQAGSRSNQLKGEQRIFEGGSFISATLLVRVVHSKSMKPYPYALYGRLRTRKNPRVLE